METKVKVLSHGKVEQLNGVWRRTTKAAPKLHGEYIINGEHRFFVAGEEIILKYPSMVDTEIRGFPVTAYATDDFEFTGEDVIVWYTDQDGGQIGYYWVKDQEFELYY